MRHQNVILVPLIGIMLGGVVNAGAVFYAYQFDIVQNMASWLQGSFSLVIEGNYELLYASIPLMLLAYVYADLFTIAGMGRDAAVALGLNHASIMRMGLVIVSIISSITIVEVGYLPFIGLIVPNIVSIFRGCREEKSCLIRLGWGHACSCLRRGRAHAYRPFEIPIGVILSVVGGAVFLTMLFHRKTYA